MRRDRDDHGIDLVARDQLAVVLERRGVGGEGTGGSKGGGIRIGDRHDPDPGEPQQDREMHGHAKTAATNQRDTDSLGHGRVALQNADQPATWL